MPRVYPSRQEQNRTEKTIITPALKVPRTSTAKRETKPISVFPQNDEAKPRLVTASRRLPETPLVARRLPEIPTKESPIGYCPSPRPEHSDKALEALYRQQLMMMGALQAPKIQLMEFHGDPMQYHAFVRSFEENVEKMLPDSGARLARLMHLCKGEAGRAIRCCNLMDPEQGYARARRLLERRFGDSHTITELWIKKLNEGGPRVNLQEYADELLECYETLSALGALQEMNAQRTLLTMITRLPIHLQNKWQDYVFDLKSHKDRRPTLKDVVEFVDRAAAVVSDPVYGSASMKGRRVERAPTRMTYAANADVRCPICEDGEHSVPQCRRFMEMSAGDRLDAALRRQICFMCLTPGHITRECCNPVKCQERGCGQRHATILHNADWEGLRRASREKREAEASGGGSDPSAPEGHHVSSSHHVMGKKVALPFLLVKVTSPETGISVTTYALLDSGSNVSLCQDKLLRQLRAHGRTERLSLTTLNKERNETTAQVISLKVSSPDGSEELTIPQVFARPHLRLSSSNLVTEADVQRWPHLKDLPLHHAEMDEVMLLIGQDCPEALIPLTTVPGKKGEPYAVRTRLGWSVSGPVSNSVASPTSHYISNEGLLQEKVDRFWKLESSGIYEQEKSMSVDDRRVLALWDEKVDFSGGHYVLPIPFKNSILKLPDNRQMAERRLSSLKHKLIKNHDLYQKYTDGMNDLLEKGYAVPVAKEEVYKKDGKIWYLPHHPVINPNKEKIRIVFDCAAEYNGVSLNNRVHQGPDLTNKLVGVLTRFRLHPVAIMADIRAMFHQVRVTLEDQDVLRFLRWPTAPTIRPVIKDDPEVKEAVTFTAQTVAAQSPVDKLIDGISNWMQLVRSVACFSLIPEVHRSKTKFTGPLGPEHLQHAENLLIRHVQNQCYAEEIKAISQGSPVPSSSSLIRLRPKLYEGLLVVPGRLTLTNLPSRVKNPVILPSRHPMVETLVRHVHERTAHSGRGYTLAELRRRYWIMGAASLVRKVVRHCVACRRRDAQPCQQMEADLPLDRVTPYEPAFTSVGVDYFGPFAVKRGRGQEKRYGCLFTCLTTRAIHIETADTLDTDSFINCLYRFMARRGEPNLIRSDNGTNFVGAERELRKEIESWNKERIQGIMSQRGIRWLFNPPAASHMGGVWERQIRSIRRVLSTTMTEQVPTSEMLTTLLVIAEGLINNRPLTPASDDPNDLEPLTPNHLLIHRPASIPPGLFDRDDLHSRRKWRQVQYLADVFWRRWTKEYLVTLRQRTKWHGACRNVKENDLVLLISSNTPRNNWSTG